MFILMQSTGKKKKTTHDECKTSQQLLSISHWMKATFSNCADSKSEENKWHQCMLWQVCHSKTKKKLWHWYTIAETGDRVATSNIHLAKYAEMAKLGTRGNPCTNIQVESSKGNWPPTLFLSFLVSPPQRWQNCDFVPHSLLSPPSLLFPCYWGKSFDVLQHLTSRPTFFPVIGVSHLTYFNIWRGGPPARQTNRPTGKCQAARRPSLPLATVFCSDQNTGNFRLSVTNMMCIILDQCHVLFTLHKQE